ncbi:g-type lectin s-receptor-like serine/threonine-protein kinase, partial [Quercus suber]
LTIRNGSNVYWTSSIYAFGVLSDSNWNGYGISWPINYTTGISKMVVDVYGQLKLQSWSEDDQRWHSLQSSRCGDYALCGAFSICSETAEVRCGCSTGFRPVSADSWSKGNSSNTGCVRETVLQCTKNIDVQKDGFFRMSIVDWPDNPQHRETANPTDCQSACLNNCSCIPIWHGALLNLKQHSADDTNGIDFYLKLATSDLVKLGKKFEDLLAHASFVSDYDIKAYKAWELWTSERGSDLVDPLLDDVSSMHVALRYVNIALLCVQESAAVASR